MPEEVYIALDRDGKFKSMDDVLSETSPGVDDFVHFFYHHKDDHTSTVGQVTWFMTDDPNDPSFRMVFYKFNADFHEYYPGIHQYWRKITQCQFLQLQVSTRQDRSSKQEIQGRWWPRFN